MKRLMIALSLTVSLSTPLRAADKVQLELSALVNDVVAILEKQDQKTIRIGKFTGDGDIPSHFGPEIQRVLIGAFVGKKIRIEKDALIEIKGDYSPATEDPGAPALKDMFLRITTRLVNTKTRLELAGVEIKARAIYGNDVIAKAFAPTVFLPPSAGRKERNDELKEAIKKPRTHVAKTKVKSADTSPFAVEILVVDDEKAADPTIGGALTEKDGCAFVTVAKKKQYRVKIHNAADFDVAIRLSIDGLDQFVFADKEFRDKDGKPKFEYMIVPAKKSAVIRGWFRHLKQADSFLVTEYAKSAVAELNARKGRSASSACNSMRHGKRRKN